MSSKEKAFIKNFGKSDDYLLENLKLGFCYNGTCNTDLFNYWIEHFLVPEIQPGFTIIMDNATFHKSQKTRELIQKSGCEILFLPPYSPDLNPIEIFWANLKKTIQKKLQILKNLSGAVNEAFLSYL